MKTLNVGKLEKLVTETVGKDIEDGKVGGAEIIVAQNGEKVFDGVFGRKNETEKLEKNAIYRIASMTKPVTAAAVLAEAARGNIDLNAYVSDYLDGFDDLFVAKYDADSNISGSVRAKNRIKVFQLLCHSSGFGSGKIGETVLPAMKGSATLQKVVDYILTQPLSFEPGTAQEYNNFGFDAAALILEKISGMNYNDYLRKNIFDKLGMNDTGFAPSEAQWKRFVAMHNRTSDGKSIFSDTHGSVFGKNPVTYFMAGGGLFSTGEDYLKFALMLLGRGKGINGETVIPQDAFELFVTPWVDEKIMPGGTQWGLGVRVITGSNDRLPLGAFGWSGAYGTHFWVDPENAVTAIYMKNSLYDGGAGAHTMNEFEKNVMSALED